MSLHTISTSSPSGTGTAGALAGNALAGNDALAGKIQRRLLVLDFDRTLTTVQVTPEVFAKIRNVQDVEKLFGGAKRLTKLERFLRHIRTNGGDSGLNDEANADNPPIEIIILTLNTRHVVRECLKRTGLNKYIDAVYDRADLNSNDANNAKLIFIQELVLSKGLAYISGLDELQDSTTTSSSPLHKKDSMGTTASSMGRSSVSTQSAFSTTTSRTLGSSLRLGGSQSLDASWSLLPKIRMNQMKDGLVLMTESARCVLVDDRKDIGDAVVHEYRECPARRAIQMVKVDHHSAEGMADREFDKVCSSLGLERLGGGWA